MLYPLLVLISTLTTILSIVAIYRATHADTGQALTPHTQGAPIPVTILKPLAGADDALEDNLETFFHQDYPAYELLFGVEGHKDPSIAIVRRLQARHPEVKSRLVIHQGKRGLNPKISNLRAMLESSSHDVVVISDSNIAVTRTYIAEMVHHIEDENVGLVTNLFVGVGEASLGATLENLHLNGLVAGSIAISHVNGRPVSVGKSMMFRRSILARLGGLESVAAILAEDYVLGRMFRDAGYELRLCTGVIHNVCTHTTVPTFLHRHLRWGLIRSRLKPLRYPLEILANPVAVALMAPLLGWGLLPAIGGVVLTVGRDALQWIRLRGSRGLLPALLLSPLKELLLIGVWLGAPLMRHVTWRGRRFRVSAGTRLYAETPPGSLLETT